MGEDAYRDDDGAGQAGVYWRRRVGTLVAGLGLLGALAWAFSGGGKPPPRIPRAPDARPAAAYRSGPAAAATPAVGSGASPSGPAAARTSSGTPGSGNPVPAAGQGRGGRCPPGAVVLSLFGGRESYPAGQDPRFEIDVVSTAPGPCTFDLGPAALHLVVMAAGRIVWDSADCARGAVPRGGGQPTAVTELSRGVPARESIAWNRTISLPGCVTAASARPGSYQAQARAAGVASPVRAFRLQR